MKKIELSILFELLISLLVIVGCNNLEVRHDYQQIDDEQQLEFDGKKVNLINNESDIKDNEEKVESNAKNEEIKKKQVIIDEKEELDNAEKALQLLNHFSTILYRITDSKDLLLLELEYDRINRDNIFLDIIEDYETINIITDIMDFITEKRINVKERELIKNWLNEDLKHAVFSTCPNPTGLLTPNPKVIAVVTTQFAFSWFFHYMGERKRLLRDFEKQEWELEKTAIEDLNELNTQLIEQMWILIKRYNIRDAYRITTPEIKQFIKYVDNDSNENRVYEFLCHNEDKYKKFPEYWYRRGRAEEKLGYNERAISSYKYYQKIYLQFLRKDKMAANVALNLSKLMIESGKYEKEDMLKQLKIIEDNVNADDWTYLYFCGCTYLDINENMNAYRVLGKSVTELEHMLAKQHEIFIEYLQHEKEFEYLDYIPPASYALMMCRGAYLEAYSKVFNTYETGKKFSELCENKLTSDFEKIVYCNDRSKLIQNLPVDLLNDLYSSVAYPDGRLYFHVPLNWFYLGNERMTIKPTDKYKDKLNKSLPCLLKIQYITGETEFFKESIDERMFKYRKDKKTDKEDYWVSIEFPFKYKWIKSKEVKEVEFIFPLRDLKVGLVYMPKANEIQLFPKEEKLYTPSVIKINGMQIPASKEYIGSYESIGESIQKFYSHK